MAKKWIILVLFIGVILSQPLWEEDMWKRSLDKIATMFSLIEDNYYEEVDYRELAYASIKGMLPTLDPHSYFLDPTNLATLTEDYRGKYFGIGCLIQKHGELLKVISPIEGGPSYRLGILPNDVISQIDGESTKPITSYQAMQKLRGEKGTEVTIGDKRLVMIGSNNYLGLTTHPKVREAAIEATRHFGTSCTGSRFLNGTLARHLELEERLADFMEKEAALVFSTGYQVNVGTISALVARGEYVITDKEDHASIVDGCRLSLGRMKRFRHNDMNDLEKQLKKVNEKRTKELINFIYCCSVNIYIIP